MSTSPGGKRVTARRGSVGGRSLAVFLLAVWSGSFAAGCVTSGDGDRMRHDISELKVRLDAIDKRDAEYKEQVVRLKKVLDDATALLARNSADVGAKAAKNEQDIAVVNGRLEELNHTLEQETRTAEDLKVRLAAMEQTQGKIGDKVGLNMPDDKEQLWAQAGQRLSQGQRDEGRRFFRTFIQRFPQDARAPQAYLLLGQSFSQESKFANAAAEFQKVLDNYASSPEVPEAMWQLALTFTQLKFCSDARALLGDLIKRYPKSKRVSDAKGELRQIAKLPKAECTS